MLNKTRISYVFLETRPEFSLDPVSRSNPDLLLFFCSNDVCFGYPRFWHRTMLKYPIRYERDLNHMMFGAGIDNRALKFCVKTMRYRSIFSENLLEPHFFQFLKKNLS